MKLYMHYELAEPNHTLKLDLSNAVSVSQALQGFVDGYNAAHGPLLQTHSCYVSTEQGKTLPPDALLPCGLSDGDDIFVVSGNRQPEAPKPNQGVKDGSAVAESQKKMGENSYYYSVGLHMGNTVAPLPTHEAKATAKATTQRLQEQTLASYTMIDGSKKVKVQVPIPGVQSLPANSIVCDFRDRSFDLKVTRSNQLLRLHIPILLEEIKQEECSVLVKAGKVVVVLAKRDLEKTWYELRKTKGIGDGEFNKIVPDSGECVTFKTGGFQSAPSSTSAPAEPEGMDVQ